MEHKASEKLVIVGSAWPLRGGLSAFNERLARAFLHAGWQVSIYTFSLQYPSFLFPGKTQYSDAPKPADLDVKAKVNSINPFNWFCVARAIRKQKPALVIMKFWIPFMAPVLGTIARLVRKNRNTRVISILDNVIPHEKRPGDKWLIRYFLNSVDGFVAMSDSVAKDLLSLKPSAELQMNPHPLYDHFGPLLNRTKALEILGLDTTFRYALFFGFIRDYKGLDLLLEALNISDPATLPMKLIVAGEFYTDPAPYLKLIKDYNLADRVVLATDFIPDDKVALYFSACDLVVQPYKTATQSGVTQIAYHFEKPMLVTDVGGLSEIVPDGRAGYVVEPRPEAISAALHNFFSQQNPDRFREGIKAEKARYSWEQMVSSLLVLCSRIQNKIKQK